MCRCCFWRDDSSVVAGTNEKNYNKEENEYRKISGEECPECSAKERHHDQSDSK